MNLYEKTEMIEAVEQSQMQQLETMGSHFMGMLSIDASDAFYQSFRSKTTLGLEMGSLVAGAYGAVKGVIAFNRLTKTPAYLSKIASKNSNTNLLKVENIIEKLEIFLGKEPRAFKNGYGDLLIESKDGLKQFRMDLNHPAPHKNSHTHLIKFEIRKNKKSEIMNERIYPINVIPE